MGKGARIDRGQESWVDIVIAFQRAIRSFETFVRPVLRRAGVSDLGVSNILMLLSIGEGPRRITDIVKSEGYGNSNASYALKSLFNENLVAKATDEVDRRVKVVRPTLKGVALIRKIKAAAKASNLEIDEAVSFVTAFESRLSEGVFEERSPRKRRISGASTGKVKAASVSAEIEVQILPAVEEASPSSEIVEVPLEAEFVAPIVAREVGGEPVRPVKGFKLAIGGTQR